MPDKHDDKYAPLEKRIGYSFLDRSFLTEALTHRSYSSETQSVIDNQRLEFFGDSILDFLVSHLLFSRFPEAREGELTRMRAALVDETSLSEIAATLGIGAHLFLGKGEERSGGREKRSLLADAYEALLAAIYLDGGINAVQNVVRMHFANLSEERASAGVISRDFKTELQEITQSLFAAKPEYELISAEGPDHDRIYAVVVKVKGTAAGSGKGKSKKEAQQAAASVALESFRK